MAKISIKHIVVILSCAISPSPFLYYLRIALIVISIMILLQIYQLMEFFLCIGLDEKIIGKLALVAITFLPPTGYFLTLKAIHQKRKDVYLWFGIAIFFAIYYISIPNSLTLSDCNPFYATFYYPLGDWYTAFYMGNIIWGILTISYYLVSNRDNLTNKRNLYVLIGYLGFILPMIFTYFLFEETQRSVTSILCKYALLLAFTLYVYLFQPHNQ